MVLNKGGSTTKSLISLSVAFRPKSLWELLWDDAVSTPAAVPTLTLWNSGPTQGTRGLHTRPHGFQTWNDSFSSLVGPPRDQES